MSIWYASLFPSLCMAGRKCAALGEMWTAARRSILQRAAASPCDTLIMLQLWEGLENSPQREKRGNVGLNSEAENSSLVIFLKIFVYIYMVAFEMCMY